MPHYSIELIRQKGRIENGQRDCAAFIVFRLSFIGGGLAGMAHELVSSCSVYCIAYFFRVMQHPDSPITQVVYAIRHTLFDETMG